MAVNRFRTAIRDKGLAAEAGGHGRLQTEFRHRHQQGGTATPRPPRPGMNRFKGCWIAAALDTSSDDPSFRVDRRS